MYAIYWYVSWVDWKSIHILESSHFERLRSFVRLLRAPVCLCAVAAVVWWERCLCGRLDSPGFTAFSATIVGRDEPQSHSEWALAFMLTLSCWFCVWCVRGSSAQARGLAAQHFQCHFEFEREPERVRVCPWAVRCRWLYEHGHLCCAKISWFRGLWFLLVCADVLGWSVGCYHDSSSAVSSLGGF